MVDLMYKFIILLTLNFFCISASNIDVTVHGFILYANGIGRCTIGYLDILSNIYNVKFLPTREILSLNDCPVNVQKIVNCRGSLNNKSKINIFTDNLFADVLMEEDLTKNIDEGSLNWCLSMCESDKIPDAWVKKINAKFDAVLVPNTFHVETYKKSGVLKPIFVLPLKVYCDELLLCKPKKKKDDEILIGSLGAFSYNKNFDAIIDSFNIVCGKNKKYKLRLHSYWYNNHYERLIEKIEKLNLREQVVITFGAMTSEDCLSFLKNLDCYVILSSGEGFSFTPREALALGLPVVISNNTAHKSICDTGLVYAVSCPIIEKSQGEFVGLDTGNWFKVDLFDAAKQLKLALNETYNEELISKRKKYVTQYTGPELLELYKQLINPIGISLGNNNIITENGIITQDSFFYYKIMHYMKK